MYLVFSKLCLSLAICVLTLLCHYISNEKYLVVADFFRICILKGIVAFYNFVLKI